ncbi:hypothetical protein Pfo_002050 [Paulownia fortunei]|nr:hypothetical protein Pfo_002050 [Paulownia fortunei]
MTTSNSSNVVGGSVGVITRSMSKKLSSSEITPLLEIVEKDLPHLANTNEDDGDLKDESTLSTLAQYQKQIASLTKAIEGLTKHVQEQDSQITKLINKVDNADVRRIMGKQVELHDELEMSTKQQSSEKENSSTKELQFSFDGLIPVDQLKEFIMGTIKDKFDGSSKSSLTYAKPYTQRIDNFKMPYTDLEANSIDSWEQLEQKFLNCFYSTRWTKEHVIDYINRWKNLSLNCKDQLSKASAIEIIQPRTFEELATRPHDIELSMAASGVEGPPIQESQMSKERYEAKNGPSISPKLQAKNL